VGEWRSGSLKVQGLRSKWESSNPHAVHSRHALAISELNDFEEKNKRNRFSQTVHVWKDPVFSMESYNR